MVADLNILGFSYMKRRSGSSSLGPVVGGIIS
jgi:hypothetical protein